jgi:hypothetical protein
MEEFQLEHTSGHWKLFIDSSEISLKAVLLHNENPFPSISLAYAVHMKETCKNLQFCCKKYTVKNIGGMYVLT